MIRRKKKFCFVYNKKKNVFKEKKNSESYCHSNVYVLKMMNFLLP